MRKLRKAWILLGEQRWLFDEQSWTLNDWKVIKNETGLSRLPFLQGVIEEDPEVTQALVWFLRRRDEPHLTLEAVQFLPADLESEEFVEEDDADPPSVGAGDSSPQPPSNSSTDETTTSTGSAETLASAPAMSIP